MLQQFSRFSILPQIRFFGSDKAQILGPGVSRPGDSENPLRSAWFFSKTLFFRIFLTAFLPKTSSGPKMHFFSELRGVYMTVWKVSTRSTIWDRFFVHHVFFFSKLFWDFSYHQPLKYPKINLSLSLSLSFSLSLSLSQTLSKVENYIMYVETW